MSNKNHKLAKGQIEKSKDNKIISFSDRKKYMATVSEAKQEIKESVDSVKKSMDEPILKADKPDDIFERIMTYGTIIIFSAVSPYVGWIFVWMMRKRALQLKPETKMYKLSYIIVTIICILYTLSLIGLFILDKLGYIEWNI